MSLSSNKKNIFTTIGAYTSLNQDGKMPDTTNVFPSINNKKDIVPFLLDILKVVVGSDALKQLTGELFTNFIKKIEPKVKTAIKKQVTQHNANDPLPSGSTNTYNISLKKLDVYGKLKQPTLDVLGNLRNDFDSPESFDNIMINAINNPGVDKTFGSALTIKYNTADDSVDLTPINSGGTTIGEWLMLFIGSMIIINTKELVANVVDAIYGTISAELKKTPEEKKIELEIDSVIEQLIDDDNDSFIVNPQNFNEISNNSKNISKGVIEYDMGCGLISASLSLDDLDSLVSIVVDSNDPFVVGNAFNKTIDDAAKDNPSTTNENKQTIRDGFFQRLIKALTLALAKSVSLSPQIRALLAISSAFQNGGIPQIGLPLDDLKKFRIFIKCNIKEILSMLNEFIFNLIVGFLISLINPVLKKLVKEKINQYSAILKTLIKG